MSCDPLGDFPAYFPPGCPFALFPSARPVAARVYRFVSGNPPAEADFTSHYVERPAHKKKWNTPTKLCKACGLSVFLRAEDALRVRKHSPSLRGKLLAEGTIRPEAGVVAPTPRKGDSHHTWWLYNGAKPWTEFHVIAEEIRHERNAD
ncbi:MAG: hypothetical protein K6T75_01270 [Acetobacteraceae bacterium]|nr:hypothetical protein [Acetobacteraceae bacterium]